MIGLIVRISEGEEVGEGVGGRGGVMDSLSDIISGGSGEN
jgi:hypothetical protein